jgi:Flp pilus assembly pilin Flp
MMFRSQRKIWAEDGQGLVEYALIILLLAVVVVTALGAFGVGLNSLFSTIVGSF